MKKVIIAAVLAGVSLTAQSESVVISDMKVTINNNEYHPGWRFPVVIPSGEDAVFTQNPQWGYNDLNFVTDGTASIDMVVNGEAINIVTYMWPNRGGNKSLPYRVLYADNNIEVYYGYADNMNPGKCAVQDCLPYPFWTDVNSFQGMWVYPPNGLTTKEPDHCGWNNFPICFDSAVIRIHARGVKNPIRQR